MRTEWPEQLSPEVWADNLYQEAKKNTRNMNMIRNWLTGDKVHTVYKVVPVQYGIWGFQVRYGFKVQYL